MEFISFGHPLIEAVLDYIDTHYRDTVLNGAVFTETLPNDNKEKKLLDGFLTGKARLMEESQKTLTQRRLFD